MYGSLHHIRPIEKEESSLLKFDVTGFLSASVNIRHMLYSFSCVALCCLLLCVRQEAV